MATMLIGFGIAVIVLGLLVWLFSHGFSSGAGSSMTTISLGATDLMLSEEKKRAAEVIVEQNAGKKCEEQASGEDNSDYPVPD